MKAAFLRLGAYQAEALLGQGGVTETYRARLAGASADSAEAVALKLLRPDRGGAEPEVIAAFVAAAHRCLGLRIPGVAPVITHAEADAPLVFAVSPLVAGVDAEGLRARIEASQPLAPEGLAGLGARIADRLAALHAGGLVHGGISPGNVLITPTADIVLLDTGISSALRPLTEQPMEKWLFTPPELLLGDPETGASDLYGLGALLYFLATGQAPFEATSRDALLARIEAGPPGLPGAPGWLEAIVRGLLAVRPEDRGAGASDVSRRLLDPVFRSPMAALVGREAPRRRKTLVPGAVRAVAAPAPSRVEPDAGPLPFDLPMAPPATAPEPDPFAPLDLPMEPPRAVEPALPVVEAFVEAFAAVEWAGDPQQAGLSSLPPAAGGGPAVLPLSADLPTSEEMFGEPLAPEAERPSTGRPIEEGGGSSPHFSSFFEGPHVSPGAPFAAVPVSGEAFEPFAAAPLSRAGFEPFAPPINEEASPPSPDGLSAAELDSAGAASATPEEAGRPRRGGGERWRAAVEEAPLSPDDPSIGPVEDPEEALPEPGKGGRLRGAKVVVPVVTRGTARRRTGMGGTLAAAGGVLALGLGVAGWLLRDRLPFLADPVTAVPTPVLAPVAKVRLDAGLPKTKPGELIVRTTPPGAAVWVDGVEQGKSPLTVATRPGGHRIVMVLAGHRMIREVAETSAGAVLDRTMAPVLKPEDGPITMRVLCRTKGKYPVFVDGKETGLLCPAEGIKVAAGVHMVGVFVVPDNKIWSFEREVLTGTQPHRVIFSY